MSTTFRGHPRRRPRLFAALAALVVVTAVACGPATATAPDDDATAPVAAPGQEPAPGGQSALAVLDLLPVKGRAPKTGFDRDLFAYREVDLDGNGCDTRNDILRRDLTGIVLKPGTQDCVVESGTLADPYSGESIPFTRGASTSGDIQVDHVVALSDAWQKGAQQLDPAARERLGNDPLNLLAVSGPLNSQKGDGDAATWLPPHKAYRCAYVARQVAVKHVYGLWVTAAERDAIAGILASCPDEPVPTAAAPALSAPAPEPVLPEQPAPGVPDDPGNAMNCTDFGSWTDAQGWYDTYLPHYGDVAELDADGNGVACESLPGAP